MLRRCRSPDDVKVLAKCAGALTAIDGASQGQVYYTMYRE